MNSMKIYHVDVFSDTALAGNGLTVIFPEKKLTTEKMQQIAQEFKQFETIFLWHIEDSDFKARIFTVEEELDFAGHPILGAAAVIHEQYFNNNQEQNTIFQLKQKKVSTISQKKGSHYEVIMNQGKAEWGVSVSDSWISKYCNELNIPQEALCEDYPVEIVSTGLPYLIIPIQHGLENVKIQGSQLESHLEANGAKFIYVFDINRLEGRTWDNLGLVEDVATGSAAGPMGAYLYKHGCFSPDQEIQIHQGRFVGRPSILKVRHIQNTEEIGVAGDVKILMNGQLEI